jgi:hypothetical protein
VSWITKQDLLLYLELFSWMLAKSDGDSMGATIPFIVPVSLLNSAPDALEDVLRSTISMGFRSGRENFNESQ